MNTGIPGESETHWSEITLSSRAKISSKLKIAKDDKEKLKKPNTQSKFELILTGDAVLAGNMTRMV